jgi:two-component system sensor histidine kinase KdpD
VDRYGLSQNDRIGFIAAVAATAATAGVMAPFHDHIGPLNAGLAFLLLTLVVSATWGWRVGVFEAIVANLSLNFFFLEPLFRFTVYGTSNAFGLLVFLIVSLVGGKLLSVARDAAQTARQRQAETEVLLGLSRELIGRADPMGALTALCESAARAFKAPGASVLSATDGRWKVLAFAGPGSGEREPDRIERLMAQQAVDGNAVRWLGETRLRRRRHRARTVVPGPSDTRRVRDVDDGIAFVPLAVGTRILGVLRIDGPIGDTLFRDRPERLLEGFAREAALGVERVELAAAAAHVEALRYADEMKTTLLASISHDLKTPLAGIKAAISSLLDRNVGWSEQDKAAFYETIDSQADRLDRLISDILDLNRIESGVVRPIRRVVAARELLGEAVERARSSTADRDISIRDGDVLVYTDSLLTVQALVNLIENAAKYSRPGGAILLGAEATPEGAQLTVTDEGPGIPEQDLPLVFDRFYRTQDATKRAKGSGLGLAIVKGFVNVCGGSVEARSSPAGTCFTITLPAASEAVAV